MFTIIKWLSFTCSKYMIRSLCEGVPHKWEKITSPFLMNSKTTTYLYFCAILKSMTSMHSH